MRCNLVQFKQVYRIRVCYQLPKFTFAQSSPVACFHLPSCKVSGVKSPCTANIKLFSVRAMTGVNPNPMIKKIDTDDPIFRGLFTPELVKLKEVAERNDMSIRIAGGAVRDLLMGVVPHDIDLATTTHPEKMKEIFTNEQIRILEYGTRAEGHGTISVRINDKVNFEITTTRSDILSNGRHAQVTFHDDWCADANRRDLTINSMFLGLDGTVYDFFNGYNDLLNKKVVFVGDAEARIREDYLRILRYFRFYGRIKALAEDHDPYTLDVISKNTEGLQGVAGERIWVELKKVIQGHFADHQIRHIIELGIADQIGLPAGCDPTQFEKVYLRSNELQPSEATVLTGLFSDKQQLEVFHKRLKLSRQELTTMQFILEHRDNYHENNCKYYKDLVIDSSEQKQSLYRCIELAKYMGDKVISWELGQWEIPKLPFSARFLVERGVQKRTLSAIVNQVRERWKDSGYSLDAEELNAFALEILQAKTL